MDLSVGDEALLEGVHRCVVRYIGSLPIKEGLWYGVEMEDSKLGKNNGNIGQTSYFKCVPGSGLFVRRGRLVGRSLPRRSPNPAITVSQSVTPPVRPGTAPESLRLNTSVDMGALMLAASSDKLKSPAKQASSRHQRTKSSVNPREVTQAMRTRTTKRDPREKRNRNKTLATIGPNASLNDSLNAQHARESDMRKEIMKLQKEHLKTLIAENKHLSETNDVLLAQLAHIESQHAKVSLEKEQLREAGVQQLEEVASERDVAIEKLAELASQVEALGEENQQLRGKLRNDSLDITSCFSAGQTLGNSESDGASTKLLERVHELEDELHQAHETQRHALRARQATNDDAAEAEAALKSQCAQMEAQLAGMTQLARQLSLRVQSESLAQSVDDAVSKAPYDHGQALHSLAERVRWDDLDDGSLQPNQTTAPMDNGGPQPGSERNAAEPEKQLAALRMRLTGRLRQMLHDSDSVRIRSKALSPPRSLNMPSSVMYTTDPLA